MMGRPSSPSRNSIQNDGKKDTTTRTATRTISDQITLLRDFVQACGSGGGVFPQDGNGGAAAAAAAAADAAADASAGGGVEVVSSSPSLSSPSWTDTDLMHCLRQCGYNVERAAEQLMTGQHSGSTKRTPIDNHRTMTKASASGQSSTTTRNKPDTFIDLLDDDEDGQEDDKGSTIARAQRRRKMIALRTTTTANTRSDRVTKDTPKYETANVAVTMHDTNKTKDQETKMKDYHQTNDNNGKDSPWTTDPVMRNNHGAWLLCRRWISDAVCTTPRGGACRYQESFEIQFDETGYPAVRFRGAHMQGKFPTHLAAMWIPILRWRDDDEDEAVVDRDVTAHVPSNKHRLIAKSQSQQQPLVVIYAAALMDLKRLVINESVPIAVEIYLPQPQRFFDICFAATLQDAAAAPWYHGGKKNKNNNSNSANNNNNKKPSVAILQFARAAFDLLQWSEHGDVPDFVVPISNATLTPGVTACSEANNENDDENDSDDDGDDAVLQKEEDFEVASVATATEQGALWSQSITTKQQEQWQQELPIAPNPPGMATDVQLRPYQQQALYWMWQREQATSSTEPDDDLDVFRLLQESSSSLQHKQPKEQHHQKQQLPTNGPPVVCDCGPVLVDAPRLATTATAVRTLLKDYPVAPATTHPAWQRRYLWWKPRALLFNHCRKDDECNDHPFHIAAFFVHPLLQTATYEPPSLPKPCSGGILADAMGLGKTVMLMALILKSKAFRQQQALEEESHQRVATVAKPTSQPKDDCSSGSVNEEQDDPDYDRVDEDGTRSKNPNASLVVVKLSLLPQWEDEIKTKTNLSYRVYYGAQAGRNAYTVEQLEGVDVVVTTYGTVQGEQRRTNSVLMQCRWLRIILDEAHCIRNPRTVASRVCCQMSAQHRWCVSGTLIQNSVDDIYGILKFLRHEPWNMAPFWKAAVSKPMLQGLNKTGGSSAAASTNENDKLDPDDDDVKSGAKLVAIVLERIRRVLAPLMLRRTKDSVSKDGQPILTLPSIESRTIWVEFSENEREFYNAIRMRSLQIFDDFIESGAAAKSYLQIFSMLQRLRQVCDHIALTVRSRIDEDDWEPQQRRPTTKTRTDEDGQAAQMEAKDALSKQFLDGLLEKFYCKQTTPRKKRSVSSSDDLKIDTTPRGNANQQDRGESSSVKRHHKEDVYIDSIAKTLARAVKEGAMHVNEECPICLENPSIEEAVLAPCAHIFCRSCLVNYLREHSSSNATAPETRLSSESSSCKDISQSLQCPNGVCPCCNQPIVANRIIALSRSYHGDGRITVTTRFLTDMRPPSPVAVYQAVVPADAVSSFSGEQPSSAKDEPPKTMARQILQQAVAGSESAKITAIMTELDVVWRMDPGSKVLIFSHYLGFLDLLENQLRARSVPFFRLDGSLSLKNRMAVLDEFKSSAHSTLLDGSCHPEAAVTPMKEDNQVEATSSNTKDSNAILRGTVLLMTMQAGGEGLNLVAASTCFLCDPWWNAEKEDQCIHRIYRIGQTAPQIRVRKFIVRDSVEERIVELQSHKKLMAREIYHDDDQTATTGIDNKETLGGGVRLSLDDFKILFGR